MHVEIYDAEGKKTPHFSNNAFFETKYNPGVKIREQMSKFYIFLK